MIPIRLKRITVRASSNKQINMRTRVLLSITLLFLLSSFTACKKDQNGDDSEDEISAIKEMVSHLSSDRLRGRSPGDIGFEYAAQFVEQKLQLYGYLPYFESYRDSSIFGNEKAFNLIAVNQPVDTSKRTVILSAHLDHLGIKVNSADSVYNGANDNASGVTAVLQIGKYLQDQHHNENIFLAFYTAEEAGLLGAKHFAQYLQKEQIQPYLVFNFDMVGTPLSHHPKKIFLSGYGLSNMAEILNNSLEETYVIPFPDADKYQVFKRSDNYPFYTEFSIPAHTFFTFDFTNYEYYHSVEDETDKVDAEHIHRVIQKLSKAINNLLETDQDIELIEKIDE